jgi:hypothetical protein
VPLLSGEMVCSRYHTRNSTIHGCDGPGDLCRLTEQVCLPMAAGWVNNGLAAGVAALWQRVGRDVVVITKTSTGSHAASAAQWRNVDRGEAGPVVHSVRRPDTLVREQTVSVRHLAPWHENRVAVPGRNPVLGKTCWDTTSGANAAAMGDSGRCVPRCRGCCQAAKRATTNAQGRFLLRGKATSYGTSVPVVPDQTTWPPRLARPGVSMGGGEDVVLAQRLAWAQQGLSGAHRNEQGVGPTRNASAHVAVAARIRTEF